MRFQFCGNGLISHVRNLKRARKFGMSVPIQIANIILNDFVTCKTFIIYKLSVSYLSLEHCRTRMSRRSKQYAHQTLT